MARRAKSRLESAEQGAVISQVDNDATESPVSPQSVATLPTDDPSPALPPESVRVQTISPVETKPVSAKQWETRRLRAEVAHRELIERYKRNRFPFTAGQVYTNSMQILLQALIMEGRITQDEVTARLGEFQLIYMEADFKSHLEERSHGKGVQLVKPAEARAGGVVWRPNIRKATTAKADATTSVADTADEPAETAGDENDGTE